MIKIDISSYVPIFEQVKAQLKLRIAAHILKPDDPLPSIRELATELLINPNTVARAYREMEKEGFIYARKGRGCFVSNDAFLRMSKQRAGILNKIFDVAIEEARTYKLSPNEIEKLFKQRLNSIYKNAEEDADG